MLGELSLYGVTGGGAARNKERIRYRGDRTRGAFSKIVQRKKKKSNKTEDPPYQIDRRAKVLNRREFGLRPEGGVYRIRTMNFQSGYATCIVTR